MEKPIHLLALCMVSMLSFTGAAAQSDSIRVDLDKALEIALTESPSITIADREVEIKEHYRLEQIGSLLPNVGASASYSRTLKKQMIAIGGGAPIPIGTDNTYNAGFNLSLPLIAPALWSTVNMSETDILLAVESARSSRLSMVNEVRKAFYQYLLAEESCRVLELSYENTMDNLQNILDKFEHGMVSEYDKLRTEVTLQNIKPQVIAARNAVYLAELQLKVLIGVKADAPIAFVGELVSDEPVPSGEEIEMMSARIFRDTADVLAGNSDIRQLDYQRKMLQQSAEVISSQFYPTLALSANYSWMTMNDHFRISEYGWYPNSSIGLSLNVPLFQGNKVRQQLKQNRLQRENMETMREDTYRKMMIALQSSLSNMATAVEEMEYGRNNIVQAQKAYDLSAERYEVGSGTLLELNDANLALVNASLTYSQSIYDYLVAKAELDRIMGIDYVPASDEGSSDAEE